MRLDPTRVRGASDATAGVFARPRSWSHRARRSRPSRRTEKAMPTGPSRTQRTMTITVTSRRRLMRVPSITGETDTVNNSKSPLQRHPPQPQRVDDHRDRAEAHRGAREHRAQQHAQEGVQHPRRRPARPARCRRRRRTGSAGCCAWWPRLSRRARTMPRRSPFTRVTSALSIATSVPVPMAMPTSACASAGASLTPSPAIATIWPSRLEPPRPPRPSARAGPRRSPRRCRACARPPPP